MFFVADRTVLESGDTVTLSGAEGRHAAVVRRLRPGERIDVGDGAGLVAECVITRVSGGDLELAVRARRAVPWPQPALTVIQAIPKGDRGELAVEEMTEVGVDRIVPWAAERSVPVWRAGGNGRETGGVSRWRAKAREAAKQAERACIPEVTDPVTTAVAANLIQAAVHPSPVQPSPVHPSPVQPSPVHPSAGHRAAGLAVVLEPGAADALGSAVPSLAGELIAVVGPEGGITEAESAAFMAAGARSYRLGPSVLRTSTAGAVAAAILLSRTPRWA